ncbi:MAG: ribosome biogenesis GTPase Der [Micrococcaceae bacterium]
MSNEEFKDTEFENTDNEVVDSEQNELSEAEMEQRAAALRVGLDDYDLDDEDALLLDSEGVFEDEAAEEGLDPILAIVGRPNVGKSTIVNRILGRRAAVVEDVPGVTRDRVSYKAEWLGKRFTIVDTGGWEVDAKGIHKRVADQAELAVDMADAVLFVVDAMVGATATDEAVVKMLRRKKKPVILAANKIDGSHQEIEAAYLWGLGMGEPYPISGLHGRGCADLLDKIIEILPEKSAIAGKEVLDGPRRVALVGRPNVGKSSLLNKLIGSERVVVNEMAGTTRDPVDELVQLDGKEWTFIDTAGIRKRVHLQKGADFYASLRTQTAVERAEVALVLIDVSDQVSEQDVRIIQKVLDAGRALVIVFNKWDTLDEERRYYLDREIELELAHVSWAPRVNLSARTGWHKDRLVRAMNKSLESWDRRIPTGRLNAFLGELVAEHPHPVRGGKQPRILFGTQVSNRPPRFVLFTTGFLDEGYRRFITRRLREDFDFEGSPIEISMRVRERRKRS